MTAIKAQDVDRAVATRKAEISLLLFYGRDAGRITERARAAVVASVQDPEDPFQLIRLDGDDIAANPGRLVEEAATYGLFGQSRGIWVRPTSRNISASVAACLDLELRDTLVVIEAGDLAKSSPLRSVCERSPRALALPCYEDQQRDLGAVVDETLRTAGLAIDRDARALLIDSLGGDRLASRGELAKLVLYMHGRRQVEPADIVAAISDVSATRLDDAIDAAFLGRRDELDGILQHLWAHGTAAGTLLSAALRHTLAMLPAAAEVAQGRGAESAIASWRGLMFTRRAAVARQLGLWSPDQLIGLAGRLQELTLTSRLQQAIAPTLVGRGLMAIAEQANASGRSLKRSA